MFKGLIIEEAGRRITPVIIISNNNQTIIIILVTGLVRNNANKKKYGFIRHLINNYLKDTIQYSCRR